MLFSVIVTLVVSTGLTNAAAVSFPNELSAHIPSVLDANDVVLFGYDGIEIVDRDYINSMTHWGDGTPLQPKPERISPANSSTTGTHNRNQRRCSSATIIRPINTSTFFDWDIPMSPVVQASPTGTTTVTVTQGYSVTNTLELSIAYTAGIEGLLSECLTVTISESWASNSLTAMAFTIPPSKYAVVVSSPLTISLQGHVDIGCIAQGDDGYEYNIYERVIDQRYGGAWPEGTISLCTSDSYPIPMCYGGGYLY